MIINFQKYASFVNYIVNHQLPFNALSVACTGIIYFDAYCTVLYLPVTSVMYGSHFNKIFLGYQLLQVVE